MFEETRSNGKNHCQLLRGAAEAMRTFGRAIGIRQDRYSRHRPGAMCALGALDYAAGNDPNTCRIDHDPIVKIVQTRLKLGILAGESPTHAIAGWSNNAPNDQVVINGFLKIAEELEAEGLCDSVKE